MAHTFSQLLIHVVFATKDRVPLIDLAMEGRLHEYIGGIIRNEKGVLCAAGSMHDHIHLLIRWRTDRSFADLMRNVKASSSVWIHETFPGMATFAWQEGYGAFSVSKSAENDVKAYINNQNEHHRVRSFEEEYLAFLRAHEIPFDERYVFR
ncbi:MAG: IS200/IS605 family transposase [Phycisphaerales bacterium]|nr:IS200/IS605 family transposase [Phycisphaerales bacterium]MCB9857967.1 IS200/IS605 family transposase [Phycisphaerales bacterium]MCB9864940.1 IS200/IS605 family transposase [Phycisphaerales bacterium]